MPKEVKVRRGRRLPGSEWTVDSLGALRSELDRVFDRFIGPSSRLRHAVGEEITGELIPSLDVRESAREVVVQVELPGVREADVKVSIRDHLLVVKGEKSSEREAQEGEYHVTERSYGSFHRALNVPDSVDVDKITAKLDGGILTVTLPKRPEAVGASREVPVERG
ncbi:MAG: Hsp20/alpha crystallin family protein [Alphaproteobacteria bacterium]